MPVSERGHALIRKFEGFSSKAYPDPKTGGAPWTYGHGFTTTKAGKSVKPGDTISFDESVQRLRIEAEHYCTPLIKKIPPQHVTQNRLDAATSFCWNIGVPKTLNSTFLKRWERGDIEGAARAMMWWVSPGSNVEEGLRTRRKIESSLFRAKGPDLVGNY